MQRICPSELTLDRLHVGDHSTPELAQLKQQLHHCDSCDQRLQERTKRFEQLHQHEGFAALLEKENQRHLALQHTTSPLPHTPNIPWWTPLLSWPRWTTLTLTAAAVYMLAFTNTLSTHTHHPHKAHSLTATHRKAKSLQPMFRALFYRKGAPYSQWLNEGQILHPGDFVQFSYFTPRTYHVMIVGLNKLGQHYVFVPYQKTQSVHIPKGKGKLPNSSSLELDDYIGPERFFFLYSTQPFSYQEVARNIKNAFKNANKDLHLLRSLRGPWHTYTLLIQKQPHHTTRSLPE